jgi:hypothetical protein
MSFRLYILRSQNTISLIDCRKGKHRGTSAAMTKRVSTLVQASIVLVSALLASWPCLAQTKLTPKGATARTDNCAPIGRTARGELVYSLKCENAPAPPEPPPPQAEVKEAPPPEPETRRTGLFGWSFDRRPEQ